MNLLMRMGQTCQPLGMYRNIIPWVFDMYNIYSCLSIPKYHLSRQSFKFIDYISEESYCNLIDFIDS